MRRSPRAEPDEEWTRDRPLPPEARKAAALALVACAVILAGAVVTRAVWGCTHIDVSTHAVDGVGDTADHLLVRVSVTDEEGGRIVDWVLRGRESESRSRSWLGLMKEFTTIACATYDDGNLRVEEGVWLAAHFSRDEKGQVHAYLELPSSGDVTVVETKGGERAVVWKAMGVGSGGRLGTILLAVEPVNCWGWKVKRARNRIIVRWVAKGAALVRIKINVATSGGGSAARIIDISWRYGRGWTSTSTLELLAGVVLASALAWALWPSRTRHSV